MHPDDISSIGLNLLRMTESHILANIRRERERLKVTREKIKAERDRLDGPFVQVQYFEQSVNDVRRYTYRDPSGVCRVDDIVEVDAAGVIKLARVRKLGRGTSTITPVKTVLARLQKETLS